MDLESLIELDRQLLLMLNGSPSLFLDGLVKTLTSALTWIPLYLSLFYIVLKNKDTASQIALIVVSVVVCLILTGTVDDVIVKPLVGRWRPTHDPVIGSVVDIVNDYRGGRFGFFSAHACNTFGIAVFFCWLVRSSLLSTALVLWSLINCWTRLYLGVHFPGDILCGLIWGAIIASIVYFIYYRLNCRLFGGNRFVSSQYTRTGFLRADADIVVSVLLLTFIYAMLRACLFLYV
ncbi:MAG: phosphatase PAP2 family protein [Prevotella sp.]|jgi:undecaprenyl-diphosphatase|nr:phosphatase PAP2 family protein [Prevotella sp.]